MPPKPEDFHRNVGKSTANANRGGTSSSSPLAKLKYLDEVGTSSGHANAREMIPTSRTVEELFPGFHGVLPRMETISGNRTVNFHNLRQLGDRRMVDPESILFAARDYVIIGWMNGDYVNALCTLFNRTDESVVFDMDKDQWYTMNRDELLKLGIGRHYKLVMMRDYVSHAPRPGSNRAIDLQAHIAAIEDANREADRVEALPEEILPREPLRLRMRAMARGYLYKYKEATEIYRRTHRTNGDGM